MEKEKLTALVRKAQAGDRQAMEELVYAAHTNVSYQCRKLMRNPQDAEDMTQEALLNVSQKLDTLDDPEKFFGWATRIASNLCINALKRGHKELQFAEDEDGNSYMDELEDTDRGSIPEAALEDKELTRTIQELVDALPEAQQLCLRLHFFDDMSIREIAEGLGIPEGTVKSRLFAARNSLHKGAAAYEKKTGTKLRGLAPLFLLRFCLEKEALDTLDTAAAERMAKLVLSRCGAGASAAAGSAAGNAAAGAVKGAAAGILGGISTKLAVGIVAGVIAVTGIVVGVTSAVRGNSDAETPLPSPTIEISAAPSAPAESVIPAVPETPADPNAPVEIAAYTARRTTHAEPLEGVTGSGVYLETPLFDEVNEGYRRINEFFDDQHARFNPTDTPDIATVLDHIAANGYGAYKMVWHVTYQDEYFLSCAVSLLNIPYENISAPAMRHCTFDVRTGELLTLEDVSGMADSALTDTLVGLIGNAGFANLLNDSNYPAGDHDFYISGEGQIIYVWHIHETVDDQHLPLPVELTAKMK